jgi:UDP:flavonoid glycosyltransferase YjiC (YdhE family)
MKTIVFGPFNGGVAHIVRSLAMAERLEKHRCIMIAEPKRFALITKNWKLPSHIELIPHEGATFYDDLDFLKKLWSGKGPRKILDQEIDFYYQKINEIKPDLIIADGNGFSLMSGYALGIPTIQVGISVLYPYQNAFLKLSRHKYIQSAIDGIGKYFANKLIQDVWNDVFKCYERRGLYDVKADYRAFVDDLDKVLFENSDYLNLKPGVPNLHCFPLPVSSFERGTEKDFNSLRSKIGDKRSVYITLGGTGYAPGLIKRLVGAFLDAGYFVICSTAQVLDPKQLPSNESLYAAPFIPGYAATTLSDVVVSHGSQGTTDHAVRSQTPLLVIPFNFDHYLTLDTHINPLAQNLMPLSLVDAIHGTQDYKWLNNRPNKIDVKSVVAAADKLPSKKPSKKVYPRPNQKDAEVAQYVESHL